MQQRDRLSTYLTNQGFSQADARYYLGQSCILVTALPKIIFGPGKLCNPLIE